ncbi:MAG: TRAP transporter substrate-binding protein DctP [Peptococcaceae bacterium]
MKNKLMFILFVLLIGLLVLGCGSSGEEPQQDQENPAANNAEQENAPPAEKIAAKFLSEEIEGDFMTVWAEKFAEEMQESSGGNFDITVYPYGTLGDTRDINELAQLGVAEYVFSDFAWISSFVPQAQVLALHYLWPRERIPEVIEWVVKNGEFMDVLEANFRKNGLVPLSVMFEGWQWISSNDPIESLTDMNGFKVRIMGSKLLVEDYQAYGAVPTPMSYGEVYSGLQMGLIEGQVNPLFAIKSMNFYEVQNYLTQPYAEPFLGIPTVNMQFFDSLPKETQEKMRQWWADAIVPAGEWIQERNDKDLETMLQNKPELKVVELSPEELAKFKENAQTVYPKFLEVGGEGAEEILEVLQKDIADAKEALGIDG